MVLSCGEPVPGDLSEVGAGVGCHDWVGAGVLLASCGARAGPLGNGPAPNAGGAQGEPGDSTESDTIFWDSEPSGGWGSQHAVSWWILFCGAGDVPLHGWHDFPDICLVSSLTLGPSGWKGPFLLNTPLLFFLIKMDTHSVARAYSSTARGRAVLTCCIHFDLGGLTMYQPGLPPGVGRDHSQGEKPVGCAKPDH